MDEAYKTILDEHKKKIEKFISMYEKLRVENEQLKSLLESRESEIEQYKQVIETKTINIKELEQKIDRLQMAEAFASSAKDVKEAKQNIARIVREIDKCIALLNN